MNGNKILVGNNEIEIHNNWIGVQTVKFNGQIVSKKYSYSESIHHFNITEKGIDKHYILTIKVSSKTRLLKSNEILIDLKCNGKIITKNRLVSFSEIEKKENNKHKVNGIKLLKEFEISDAINELKMGLHFSKNDPEIYFYLACCYSIKEDAQNSFSYIKLAVENNLNNEELILNHEMLAFIRIQNGFEEFKNSGFIKFVLSNLEEE